MDSEIAEHVADLHRKAFIIDAHFDLTHEVANRRERGAKRVVDTDCLPGFLGGGVDLIVSAIFVHDWFLPKMGLRKALDQIACLHREMDETPGPSGRDSGTRRHGFFYRCTHPARLSG